MKTDSLTRCVIRGIAIDYNVYGCGEYTIQYEGDDMWFNTLPEAQEWILDNVEEVQE